MQAGRGLENSSWSGQKSQNTWVLLGQDINSGFVIKIFFTILQK